MTRISRSRAFTLIEVLFALAIVATAITALTKAGVDYANSANYLRDKTFARWVATDKLTEMQIENAWPDLGKEEGERVLAGQTWFWRVQTERVEDALLRQVTIQVRLRESASGALATVTGFMGDPSVVLQP